MDAEAALSYVLKREDLSEKVVLFGRSLGGAVAIQLGSANKDTVRWPPPSLPRALIMSSVIIAGNPASYLS